MEEYLDIFDEHENLIGTKTRDECHVSGVNFYHRVVWGWLINSRNEILIQQRSWDKKDRPGCWEELSVAGHVLSEETPEHAFNREVFEELGIDTTNLKFLHKWICKYSNEIVYFFIGKTTYNIDKITLQQEEVASAKFVKFKDFKNMLKDDVFGSYPLEYKTLVENLLSKELE